RDAIWRRIAVSPMVGSAWRLRQELLVRRRRAFGGFLDAGTGRVDAPAVARRRVWCRFDIRHFGRDRAYRRRWPLLLRLRFWRVTHIHNYLADAWPHLSLEADPFRRCARGAHHRKGGDALARRARLVRRPHHEEGRKRLSKISRVQRAAYAPLGQC